MLVLAIAVLVMQHVLGGVRLKPAHTERKADVAEVRRHIIVERLNFIQIGGFPRDQRSCLGANLCVGLATVLLQTRIPVAHLLPTGERGHLHRRRIRLLLRLLFLLVFVLFLISLVGLNVRTRPGINAAAVGFGNLRIIPGLGFQLDRAFLGNIEFKLLI